MAAFSYSNNSNGRSVTRLILLWRMWLARLYSPHVVTHILYGNKHSFTVRQDWHHVCCICACWYALFLPSTTSMTAIPTREGMTPEAAALTAIAPPMLHRVLKNTVNWQHNFVHCKLALICPPRTLQFEPKVGRGVCSNIQLVWLYTPPQGTTHRFFN